MLSKNEFEEAFKTLKRNKTSSHDGLDVNIITSVYEFKKKPLLNIFNESINLGIFPEKMKIAEVTFTKVPKRAWLRGIYCYNYNRLQTDSQKACLPHHLLIAKLEAYGLDNDSLNLLLDYLRFRKQKTKVGSAYSKWSKIRRGIPHLSKLGPILFNILINDIFMIIIQIFAILQKIIPYTHAEKI